MKFHKQQHLYKGEGVYPNGSCYPTVYACLLDLELDEVLYFHLLYCLTDKEKRNVKRYLEVKYLNGKEYDNKELEEYQKTNYNHSYSIQMQLWELSREYWLAARGYREEYITNIEEWLATHKDISYLVSGKSSRGVDHVVIYMNGKPYHDPHPSNDFLADIWKEYPYTWLTKIE